MNALLFLAALAGNASAETLPLEMETGIFRVSSTYGKGEETGTGVLVRKPGGPGGGDRYFVFTCAHLTGGSDVRLAGVPLRELARGRRTDAFRDVDVIEIDPRRFPVRPFAEVRGPEADVKEVFRLFAGKEGEYGDIPGVSQSLRLDEFVVDPVALERWRSLGPGVVPMTPRENGPYTFLPPWSNPALVVDGHAAAVHANRKTYDEEIDIRGQLIYSTVTKTISAPAKIAPGMSCAPLVASYKDSPNVQMIGLGTEFRVANARSTFASQQLLLENFSSYLQGDLKPDVPARWKIRDGLLYLQIGKNSAEILPDRRPAGNGATVPPGNGATVPPGNGATVPPGNGATVPPGAFRASTSPRCDPRELTAKDPWKKSKTKPGVLWNGKPVMGFAMRFPVRDNLQGYPESKPFLIYPDRAGIEFRLSNARFAAKVESVPLGSSVLPWLDQRYERFGPKNTHFDVERPRYRLAAPAADGQNPGLIERKKDSLHIALFGPPPENDPIDFTLNEQGGLVSDEGKSERLLKPVVEVKGKSGKVYEIDLTDLFYLQTAAIDPESEHERSGHEVLSQIRSLYYAKKSPFPAKTRAGWMGLILGPFCNICDRPVNITFHEKCSALEFRTEFRDVEALPTEIVRCEGDHEVSPPDLHGLEDVRAVLKAMQKSP